MGPSLTPEVTSKEGMMKSSRNQRAPRADHSLPEDALTVTALEARLFGHAGFPEAADALAYDSVQRILAVSLSATIPLII